MAEIDLNDQNFETEVLKSGLPVLVDFYADWCGPCKMIAPIVESLAKDYEGKIRVGRLDVDKAGVTAQKYGIMSIPTLILFKGGQVVSQIVGYQPKEGIKKKIEEAIG